MGKSGQACRKSKRPTGHRWAERTFFLTKNNETFSCGGHASLSLSLSSNVWSTATQLPHEEMSPKHTEGSQYRVGAGNTLRFTQRATEDVKHGSNTGYNEISFILDNNDLPKSTLL